MKLVFMTWVPLLLLFIIAGATRATAQDPPATSPATAPADAPAPALPKPDTSTPKGTLKLLSDAMEAGDEQAMRRLMLAEDPLEERMVAAQVAQAQAFARFRAALVAAFGQQAFDELTDNQQTQAQRYAMLDAAEQQLDGQTATITVGMDVYELKQIDGQWLLSLKPTARNIEPAMLEESLRQMKIKSEVMQEIATEIAEGKYQNTDEVGQAVQGKLMVALMRTAAATQEATTQPGAER